MSDGTERFPGRSSAGKPQRFRARPSWVYGFGFMAQVCYAPAPEGKSPLETLARHG